MTEGKCWILFRILFIWITIQTTFKSFLSAKKNQFEFFEVKETFKSKKQETRFMKG